MPTPGNRRGQRTEQESPQLRVTVQDARDKIETRISEGGKLLDIPVSDKATLEDTKAKYYSWGEYNETLLERLFSTDKLVQEYRGIRIAIPDRSFPEAVQHLREDIQHHMRRLESIRDRLELYENPTIIISPSRRSLEPTNRANPRQVFVVHGRNENVRRGIFGFLRTIGLDPIEWTKAVEMTGKAAPYVGEVLDIALAHAQAIVVVMTPDDEAKLRDQYVRQTDPDYEKLLTPQARPNVLFEAGLALGRAPDRTILVEIGYLRPFSDIVGRHIVRLDNSPEKRADLASRLRTAGCAVDTSGTDWHGEGNFSVDEVIRNLLGQVTVLRQGASEAIAQAKAEPAPLYPSPVVVVNQENGIPALQYLLHRGTELEGYLQQSELSQWGMPQLEMWLQRWLNTLQSDVWQFIPDQAQYILSDDGLVLEREVYKYAGWNANLAARRVVLDRRLGRLREICSQIPALRKAGPE